MIDCARSEEKSEKEILSGEYVVSLPNRVGFSRIMEEMTDRDFVRRIKSGDAEAWRKIFSRYFLACVRFVSGITGDDAAAKDIVQDGFMKLWTSKGRLVEDSNLESLLYVIMKNGALNFLRSRRKTEAGDIFAKLSDADSTADEKMVAEERRVIFRKAVESLPEQRKAVIEKKLGGGTNKEISQELNLSEKTVENYVTLARRDLKNRLS